MSDQQPRKILRVGDVLFFGKAERVLVQEVDPVSDYATYQPICKDGRRRSRGCHTLYGWSGSCRNRGYEDNVERNIFTEPKGSWRVTGEGQNPTGGVYVPVNLVYYNGKNLTVRRSQWAEYGLPPEPTSIPLERHIYSRRS